MRGPGGWVVSMRRTAMGSLLGLFDLAGSGVFVADDALAVGVDAVGDEGPVAGDAEAVDAAGGDRDRHPRRHLGRARLAVEPGFADARKHGQHLDVRVRMLARRVAGLRGLDAGADRDAGAVVVADQRAI